MYCYPHDESSTSFQSVDKCILVVFTESYYSSCIYRKLLQFLTTFRERQFSMSTLSPKVPSSTTARDLHSLISFFFIILTLCHKTALHFLPVLHVKISKKKMATRSSDNYPAFHYPNEFNGKNLPTYHDMTSYYLLGRENNQKNSDKKSVSTQTASAGVRKCKPELKYLRKNQTFGRIKEKAGLQ